MKVIVTSGGTTEAIDRVRGITNHSTGQLGKIITETLLEQGHEVTLVTTKQAVKPQEHAQLRLVLISDVASLMAALETLVPAHDTIIHAMAVSDYTPVYMTDLESVQQAEDIQQFLTEENKETKISSQSDYQVLFLKKTPKVISYVKKWNPSIRLIGFKLLVDVPKEELISVARASLERNQADLIVANDLTEINATQHHAYLVGQHDVEEVLTRSELAHKLIERFSS